MRLLRINDINVDIDDQTAIGIDFQSYDIKNPGKRYVNISNTFTIPLTANNRAIFGNAEDPQSLSTKVYEDAICSYWVDNQQLIDNARCRVDSIQDRISLFIFQKDDIWDQLKDVLWGDFITDFVDWGENVKNWTGVGISNALGSLMLFLNNFRSTTEGIILPMYQSNLYQYDPTGAGTVETIGNMALEWYDNAADGTASGGHFCIYVKSIFEFIEYTYDVNFLTSGGVADGNIWDDPIATALYVPARDLECNVVGNPASSAFINKRSMPTNFLPHKNLFDKADKTLYDFVNAFFQHLNIIIDRLYISGEYVFRLARFDDMETDADVVDWSGLISGTPTFKPLIDGITQENIIKFKEIYPEGDSLLNSKTLTCGNTNIDYTQDFFEIDAYVNSVLDINPPALEYVPDLSNQESFRTFSFFLSNGYTTNLISVNIKTNTYGFENYNALTYQIAELYDLDSEYNFFDDIIENPKVYEINKWIKLSDMNNFEFFKQYFIKELNGSFFINKISGFNPDKSKDPTTIELIKLSDRTPDTGI